jgi:CRISPR-associated endonuclease/helicase Cas3
MHQLAKSAIIFDEVQSLPINCVHLFNNAINFLTEQCGSTAIMCTATQPLLPQVDAANGCLKLTQENELIGNVEGLFNELRRVDVIDSKKVHGWEFSAVAELAIGEMNRVGSCLTVVNTKTSARALYQEIATMHEDITFHLSTNMCPAHRKDVLKTILERLKLQAPTICVSTQLIEAGIDIDFGAVIRYMAGLDSIAQAAGRCNRNGRSTSGRGKVYVVNPADENLGHLIEIKTGAEKTKRVLDDFRETPDRFGGDLIGPRTMDWFYKLYFRDRSGEMAYPVGANVLGRDDSILNLLSRNSLSVNEYGLHNGKRPPIFLNQAFMASAKAFEAINSPTRGIVVPYGDEGVETIGLLCSGLAGTEMYDTLRKAQQFTVNVFDRTLKSLDESKAVHRILDEVDILYLDEQYYHPRFGLVAEPVTPMRCLNA